MAFAPIFENTRQTIGGAFTAENCRLDIAALSNKGAGAIVQRVNFTITRPINFVYELAPNNTKPANVYYVGGRRQGQATFERVVGGSDTFVEFLTKYGPLCDAAAGDITLTAKGGCKPGGGALGVDTIYKLITPKLTTVGASVSAQEIVILENCGLVFLDLEVDNAGAAVPPAGGGARPGPGGAP